MPKEEKDKKTSKKDEQEEVVLAELSDEDLTSALDEAITRFDTLQASESVSEEDIAEMRKVTAEIEAMRTEQGKREEQAAELAAEMDELKKQVHGEAEEGAEASEDQGDGEGDGGDEGDGEGGEAEAETPAPPSGDQENKEDQQIAASASKRKVNIQAIRSRQKRPQKPEEKSTRPVVELTASADVPGFAPGQTLDSLGDVATAIGEQARAIHTRNGSPRKAAKAARYSIPVDDDLIVNDIEPAEGTAVTASAADTNRLPVKGDLVASGGWCAPSETVYDIAGVACPDMLWGPPEIQLARGGIRLFATPALDISENGFVWTEDDDISAADGSPTKDCFKVPCPDPREFRCTAYGACVEAGLLTSRAFPELIERYVANAMVAHEINVKRALFTSAINDDLTQHVTAAASFGAFTAVFGAVAFQAADLTEKQSLCENIGVEVVFPWWSLNLFLADIARQNGRDFADIDPTVIRSAFGKIGVLVSFARSLPPSVPTDIGGAGIQAGWPDEVPFLISPAGAFQAGRGMVVDLGVVQDSAKFATNDYTALFTEECVTIVARGPEARYVTVPVCPDGSTGSQDVDINCPVDGGTVGS